jgi:hypothetical protein
MHHSQKIPDQVIETAHFFGVSYPTMEERLHLHQTTSYGYSLQLVEKQRL